MTAVVFGQNHAEFWGDIRDDDAHHCPQCIIGTTILAIGKPRNGFIMLWNLDSSS